MIVQHVFRLAVCSLIVGLSGFPAAAFIGTAKIHELPSSLVVLPKKIVWPSCFPVD